MAWCATAQEDLALARQLVGHQAFPRQSSYSAQQAAEKSLKALLTAHGLTFPKTHDLIQLHALLPAHHATLPPMHRLDLATQTSRAIRGRYPHTGPAAMADEARRACEDASTIVDLVTAFLEQHRP